MFIFILAFQSSEFLFGNFVVFVYGGRSLIPKNYLPLCWPPHQNKLIFNHRVKRLQIDKSPLLDLVIARTWNLAIDDSRLISQKEYFLLRIRWNNLWNKLKKYLKNLSRNPATSFVRCNLRYLEFFPDRRGRCGLLRGLGCLLIGWGLSTRVDWRWYWLLRLRFFFLLYSSMCLAFLRLPLWYALRLSLLLQLFQLGTLFAN